MKLHAVATLAAAAALWAGAASATVTITSISSAPGDAALGHGVLNGGTLANGQVMIDNFGDNGGAQTPIAGFSFTPQVFDQDGGPAGYIRSGLGPPQLLGGESAPPPIYNPDPNAITYETGNYYTVTSNCVTGGTGCTHTASLNVLAGGYLTSFSFYLGSPDTYNYVSFYGANGQQIGTTLQGNQIWACPSCAQSGFQGFGARAVYNFGTDRVTRIDFTSSGNSFEFDNLAGTLGVPEPATWGLMIVGFGGIGAVLRRRRGQAALA